MKKIIFHLLCNNTTGFLISKVFSNNIPNIRLKFMRFITNDQMICNKIKAMIFFGFYESAETRLIFKHLPSNLPVVELGASIGISSKLILSKLNDDAKLFAIEANPKIINLLKMNTGHAKNIEILNRAISYDDSGEVNFIIASNNTESRINLNKSEQSIKNITVKTIKLIDIIQEEFVLISDIEGAEIGFILNDKVGMSLCTHLFIELHETAHETTKYSVNQISEIIQERYKMILVERDGNVFYFKQK